MLPGVEIGKEARVPREFEGSGVRVGEETRAALTDANEVARMQFIRFRRRLGSLTYEQELQIESLLISTVSKMSLLTGKVMEAMTKNPPTKLEWCKTRQYKQEPEDS